MVSKSNYIKVTLLLLLLFMLTGCDLYSPKVDEGVLAQKEKADYLDGESSVESNEGQETDVSNEETQETEVTQETEEVDVNINDATSEPEQETEETDTTSETLEETESTTILLEATEANQALARTLNNDGYTLYTAGKYEEALEKFKESTVKDNQYFYGHFNYACTLGVLMKENYEYWFESKDEIINELRICLEIDPNSRSKIMNDSDLELVRSEFEYLTDIAGYDLSTTEGVINILEKSNWYVRGNGVLSVLGQLDFEDNRVTFSYLNLENFDDGLVGDPIISSGTFSYNGNVISFKMDNPTLKRRSLSDVYNNYDVIDDRVDFIGTISSDGILTIDGFEYQYYTWYAEFSA